MEDELPVTPSMGRGRGSGVKAYPRLMSLIMLSEAPESQKGPVECVGFWMRAAKQVGGVTSREQGFLRVNGEHTLVLEGRCEVSPTHQGRSESTDGAMEEE
jgi:hypothetical protein